jgi:hypothetical protein
VGAAVVIALRAAAARAQQYPVAPSPVLDITTVTPTPRFGGYLSVREALRRDTASISVNRARLTVTGTPLSYVAIRLQGDFSSGASGHVGADSTVHGFTLTDAYVQFRPAKTRGGLLGALQPALIAGQFKQPFSLEYLTPFSKLLTADRSAAVDKLSPKRDIGVMAQGQWAHRAMLALSVANGEGSNVTSNPDGRQLVIGRLTFLPFSGLAIAAKLANQGADHLRGYDGRWIAGDLTVEGEAIHRSRVLSGTNVDAGGGYAMAAYRILPWLEPVFKQEWYRETRMNETSNADTRSSWSTIGTNLSTRGGAIRLLVDWVIRSERPVTTHDNELDAQLVASF